MHPNAPRRVPALLDVIPFPAPSLDLAWVRCVKCSGPMDLHQPATDSPGRLLGVCGSCGRWVLVELVPGEAAAAMILLPEAEWVVAALRSPGPAGEAGPKA